MGHNWIKYILFLAIFVMKISPMQADEEFRFQRADGMKLLLYDNFVAPDNNGVLSNFHDKEFIIDGEGYLQLGSFGKVYVADMTAAQVTKLLEDKFRTYGKNLTIFVMPMIRVVLRGEFNQSGMFRFSPELSFWDVVSSAGGMSNSLIAENIYVLREGEVVYADFFTSLSEGTSLRELGIQSGDEIVAPRINRVSFQAIIRYVNFAVSLVLLYYALNEKSRN